MTAILEPLHHSVSDFQTGCNELEEVLANLFQEMDRLRMDLVKRTSTLDQQHAKLEDQQQQLDHLQDEVTRLTDVEARLAETRQQLVQVQQESNLPKDASDSSDEAGRLAELTQERDALEEELELVRGRASELTETVAAQKRQLNEREADTSGELHQLRRLVEKQAELISERTAPETDARPRFEASQVAQPAENDAVVSSVMAQFAKLQKNVSQRRQRNK